jgi:predicted phosphoribosyltransferase
MAKLLADRIGGDLDVVLVHKIGAPNNPEFAIGSVSEFGSIYRSDGANYYGLSLNELEKLAAPELFRLKKRRDTYSPLRPPINPANRTVIIVDDGIATGSTMLAAVRALRQERAAKIIVAAPVSSFEAEELLEPETDELVILETPVDFFAISQFYDSFPQVSDTEVESLLSDAAKTKRAA